MKQLLCIAIFTVLVFGAPSPNRAFDDRMQRYSVIIKNITSSRVIMQPVIISHNEDFQMFVPGSPAMPQLLALAEGGDAAPLLVYAASLPSVFEAVATSRYLAPGASVTLEINTNGKFGLISAVGMVASEKGAFFAVQKVRGPEKGERTVDADMFDAGGRENPQACAHTLGSTCGNNGIRSTGKGPLSIRNSPIGVPESDPVAEITIRAIR